MAIILDDSARDAVARRRARGKDATLSLRLDRSSLRAGVPWVMTVGWTSRRRAENGFVLRHTGDVQVRIDLRIARYAQWRDLIISGARLGPWRWPVVADPFAFEHMREWERSHPDGEAPAPMARVGAGGR